MDLDELKSLGIEDDDIASKILGKYSELSEGINKLKSKNEELITEKRKVTSKLGEYESKYSDIDVEEYQSLKQKIAQIDEQDLIDKNKFHELNEKREKKMQEELSARDSKFSELLDKHKRNLKEVAISKAVADSDGEVTLFKFMLPDVQVVEDNGEFNVIVLDDNGKPRVNNLGEPMSPTEYAQALAEDDKYKGLFKQVALSGGGAQQSKGGANGGKIIARDAFNAMPQHERQSFLRTGGKIA